VGRFLSRSGRSEAAEHLRSLPTSNTYNQEDDALLTRNFGGVLGSYPTGRLYLYKKKFTALEDGVSIGILPLLEPSHYTAH